LGTSEESEMDEMGFGLFGDEGDVWVLDIDPDLTF